MKPSRWIKGFTGASSGVTFTKGFPAFAMMKGSPLEAKIDQLGELGLGFVYVDDAHESLG
jgi:hypothetical protein